MADRTDSVLNAQQAAEFLGAHVETVRRLARSGQIPSFKVGGSWRFSVDALRQWFDAQQPTGGPATVLVVDDEPNVVRAMSRMIGRLGSSPLGSTSAVEALALINRVEPDLIFLDLDMPVMNGPQFLEQLRLTHPAVPVVIVTGNPDGDLMQEAARHPPLMLLTKPTKIEDIERTMRSVLGDRMPAETVR